MRPIWASVLTGLVGLTGGTALGMEAISSVRPETATYIPWSANAQKGAARAAINDGSRQRAAAFARRAVAAMPVDQFSLAASSDGKPARQQLAILNLAAALGWRDAATNLALIAAALRENEPAIAAQRIDALGRTAGAEAVIPLADELLRMKVGASALAARAQARSGNGWWGRYFRSKPENREIAELRALLLSRFDREDGVWLRTMIRDAGIGLSKGGHEDLTLKAWRASLPEHAPFAGPIYDPSFTHGAPKSDAIGGEWRIAPAAPALISALDQGGIVIEREQASGGAILSQMLPVDRGRWILKTDASEDGKPALEWQMTCLDGTRLTIDQADSGEARRVIVPAGCPIVRLALFAISKPAAGNAAYTLQSVKMVRAE